MDWKNNHGDIRQSARAGYGTNVLTAISDHVSVPGLLGSRIFRQSRRGPPIYVVRLRYEFGGAFGIGCRGSGGLCPAVRLSLPMAAPKKLSCVLRFNNPYLTRRPQADRRRWPRRTPARQVTQLPVTGHTDSLARMAYNILLSRRRANRAAELEKDGIPSSRDRDLRNASTTLLVPTSRLREKAANRRVFRSSIREAPLPDICRGMGQA